MVGCEYPQFFIKLPGIQPVPQTSRTAWWCLEMSLPEFWKLAGKLPIRVTNSCETMASIGFDVTILAAPRHQDGPISSWWRSRNKSVPGPMLGNRYPQWDVETCGNTICTIPSYQAATTHKRLNDVFFFFWYMYPDTYRCMCVRNICVCVCVCVCTYLCVCVYLPTYLLTYLPTYLLTYLPIFLPTSFLAYLLGPSTILFIGTQRQAPAPPWNLTPPAVLQIVFKAPYPTVFSSDLLGNGGVISVISQCF